MAPAASKNKSYGGIVATQIGAWGTRPFAGAG